MPFTLRITEAETEQAILDVCVLTRGAGGRALLLGGCVRDAALGLTPKDFDLEVYGLEPARLHALLRQRFAVDVVGQAFGVFKLQGHPIDVAVPYRRTVAGASGKREADPQMTPEDAAARRDLTINAVAYDPLAQTILDPYGGLRDLEMRCLRHTSEQFAEDPLRVLRCMQFAARFDFEVAPETVALARTLTPQGLARERAYQEWCKLILLGTRPSRGLWFLQECGWLRYYPELNALVGCPQEPDHHPEGDVWVHTLHCLDAFAHERAGDDREDLVVGFAVLCHDLGKPASTTCEDGRLHSRGHESTGVEPTRIFLSRLTNQENLIEEVITLVRAHLRPFALYETQAGDRAILRLARDVGRIDRLVRVARADHRGRPPRPDDGFPAGAWLLQRSRDLAVERAAPAPIVMGRHLVALGVTPGPGMGRLLDACYEAQLDGKWLRLEDGLQFAKELLAQDPPNPPSTG